ncbi:AAA domain-containing protein [Candidatus Peregrinibacteria bacterium]|nr:AAA domain-containing protein [Candidatus Peregrinibacteria bacterium]
MADQNNEQPNVDESSGNKPIDSADAARILSAFSVAMKSSGNEDIATEAEQTAQSARSRIEREDANEGAVEEDEMKLPVWAKKVPDVEKVFVPKEIVESIDLWRLHGMQKGKGEDAKIIAGFERQTDTLFPGKSAEDQVIALKPIENSFSIIEWETIVQPVLERYEKLIELKAYQAMTQKSRKKYADQVRNILPEVFPKNPEVGRLKADRVLSNDVRKRVMELIDEVNTNPQIVRDWIMEAFQEIKGKKVEGARVLRGADESDVKKASIQEYPEYWKKMNIKKLKAQFARQKKGSFESYVDDLALKISRLGEQMLYLNTKYRMGIYRKHEALKDFVETPYVQTKLEELTGYATKQLKDGKGGINIIGDMGTGKNYLVEHFAASANRPYFYFPCSRGMDASDLGFHYEFKDEESVVVPSQLARGLRTKNAVILVDEPNSLQPEVIAALHGIADHNREFVYNGHRYKAAEGITVVFAMNPATYAHVQSLPEAMYDRTISQSMRMDYPPLTELDKVALEKQLSNKEKEELLQQDNSLNKVYVCDEALILRKVLPKSSQLSDSDFADVWDYVVNGNGGADLEEKGIDSDEYKKEIEMILKILLVCDAWRKKYKEQDMVRTISLRGALAVAARCQELQDENEFFDVKKAFLSLFHPNSLAYDGGTEDYESLQQIVNDKAELEMSLNDITNLT